MGVWKKGAVKRLLCSRWLWALLLCLSCARAGSATVGYSLVTAGQCTDEPNRVALFDAAECMAAVIIHTDPHVTNRHDTEQNLLVFLCIW